MSKRKTPGLNTGAMSDISFLLLTFFLLTSSINTEQGIPRKLPPPKTEDAKDMKVDINKRNVLNVLVNFRDEISVNGDVIMVSDLKARAKEFFANPSNDPSLPEKVSKPIDGIGDFQVSKGVVSLTNDQGTSYNMYVQVQNELQRAVNELRNETALQYFGKKFDALDSAAQRAVSTAIPMNISEAPPMDYSNNGGK
ncbi:MAG: biopolymer transporter ExbD [Bacteroidales bacterium]|jgi:biopolymer transport protein ExbD|nr:biopolymer transporter ExbD [Bacteroidales bacterium]MBR6064608.1 biopolymer transporter ExbD [Bacteroidales bacterium]